MGPGNRSVCASVRKLNPALPPQLGIGGTISGQNADYTSSPALVLGGHMFSALSTGGVSRFRLEP